MAREDWRDDETERARRNLGGRDREDFGQADYSEDYAYDPRSRTGYRTGDRHRRRDDDGQADYTNDWAYDPDRGRPYRRFSGEDRSFEPHDRSWLDRAGDFLSGRPRSYDERRHDDERRYEAAREDELRRGRHRRRGASDRVLWAVIMERLEDERRLDLSDVDVSVHDGEVTLNGTVRRREDKRRIEDLAEVDGVHNVQNNLRPRDVDRHWTFL
jgi:hypothetical protein